jgi:hypothetical protein
LVTDASFLGPLAYEFLRRLVLARSDYELISWKAKPHYSKGVLIIRSVDEVSLFFWRVLAEVNITYANLTYTEIEVGVKKLEGALLIHGTHANAVPFVPNAHRA